jgi:protein TonB
VPPPEVQVPPPPVAAPAITAVQAVEPPPKPVEIKPPPPPAPPPPAPPPPAPPPPASPPPKPVEVAALCPDYKDTLTGALAGQFDRVGITGVVKVNIKFQGNKIVEVQPVSGPREYFRAVQNAVRRFNCSVNAPEATVTLEVSFREQ